MERRSEEDILSSEEVEHTFREKKEDGKEGRDEGRCGQIRKGKRRQSGIVRWGV
jgi:hypothetical protein